MKNCTIIAAILVALLLVYIFYTLFHHSNKKEKETSPPPPPPTFQKWTDQNRWGIPFQVRYRIGYSSILSPWSEWFSSSGPSNPKLRLHGSQSMHIYRQFKKQSPQYIATIPAKTRSWTDNYEQFSIIPF